MIKKNIKYILAAGLLCGGISTVMTSCSDILDEQPRSQFDTTFFKTKTGMEGAMNSLYAHLRQIYGDGYFLNSNENGTDEYTYAESGGGENFKAMDFTGTPLNSNNSDASRLWNVAFSNINTATGIIELGKEVGASDEQLAEAYFFRAFDYFLLVQTYGGVPLDLGSGELKFNTSTLRSSSRNTVPEVYAVIFADLEKALADLPENPRLTGTATKNLARLYLSKAYLTYAWWLENPNNIPTYPACDRDKSQAQSYFQKAYDTALDAIKNPGPYKLMETFYDVNVGSNDHNAEVMLFADHNENEKYGNGGAGYGWGNGAPPENYAYWFSTFNYTTMNAVKADKSGLVAPIRREAVQQYGRPWTRIATVEDAFVEGGVWEDEVKAIDSRYDATFTLRYHTNLHRDGYTDAYVWGANDMKVYNGDVYFSFVDEATAELIDNTPTKLNDAEVTGYSFGKIPGRADFVRSVKHISRRTYPINWKIGMTRSDNNGSVGSGKVNGGSPRPWNIAKFSELYLIAAEAAVKGAATKDGYTARVLVNVLRERAGKQTYNMNDDVKVDVDNSAAMVAATPENINIDFILDERSREFWGEGYRWYDLVRTQKWNDRAGTYHIAGNGTSDINVVSYTRTIAKENYLRPIPQGQIDGMEVDDEAKEAFQNPGY